ncbi:MAG: aminotransferase class I/II-fold pyridoxal phosphate-dependent enzyme, partial [Opitutales bacterium]|nr:aminotransferase class I/II-fold pyridoxal phosphate-dependent enzyme [Opitutales bacterium]
FCNPNNPTADWTDSNGLLQVIRAQPQVRWIVDEAFVEFVPTANGGLLSEQALPENLIVVRSLTKSWCIPGLRLGFVYTTNPDWHRALRAQQHPWSINSVLISWARHTLTSDNYRRIRESLEHLPDLRRGFVHELDGIPGCEPLPGDANYVLVRLSEPLPVAGELCECMGKMGFLIRNADNFIGLDEGAYVRLAVRAPEENRRLVEALKTLVGS